VSEITRVINAIREGDSSSSAKLFALVYDELRRLARARMVNERGGHTLQGTVLVHEVFLRLLQDEPAAWDSRRHFFAAAAEAMRRILIEHARAKHAVKRGGGLEAVNLDVASIMVESPFDQIEDVLALDEALDRLGAEHPESAELVKLLYFAGLNLDEAAAALRLSRTTTYRKWLFARAWLRDAIGFEKRTS